MPDYSYLIVQIDQPRYDKTTGILALDAKNAALDKYDKTRVMAIMCKGIYRHWSYIDFPMQYDPAILDISDASVRFTIVGVNESSVYLTGDMSLQQVVYQAQLHSEDDSLDLSQIFSAGQRAYLAYKDARSQVESLRAEAAAHPNSWLGQLITGIDTAAPLAGKWYPVVKAATGLVSYFMQQGNKGDSTTTPIQLEGVFSASGSISSFAPIDQITVGVPGCKFTPTNPEGNIQPLFDDPVGVFALNKMPQIQLDFDDVMQDCVGSIYHPVKIIYWNVIGSLKEPLEVVINQIPGYDITVNAAFVYNQEDFNEKYPGKFVEITTFNQATIAPVKLHLACHEYYRGAEIDILEWLKTHNKGDGVYSDYLPKVALEVEVKKTSSDEDPFRVIKVYPVKYVTSVGSFSYHACPKEPLPPKEPR
ncbi:MAG: hypothetical protein NTW06_00530 [Candidatus Falkowbacteria bacterium]|nr:hypothetical protein [Candidatus Falkowbacteria bacterium]